MKKSLPLVLCLFFLKAFPQNSMVGDGFGGRSWYVPHNYQAGAYSAFTVCDSNNQLYGWGHNQYGELGNGDTASTIAPVAVRNMTNVRFYTTGYGGAVIKYDSTAWVWGHGYDGSAGLSGFADTPLQVLSGVRFADAGINHTVFVKYDGTVWGVGQNSHGQLGNGSVSPATNPITTPVMMSGITNAIRAVAVGYLYYDVPDNLGQPVPATVILTWDGDVAITGGHKWFTNDSTTVPVFIPGLTNVVDIKGCNFSVYTLNAAGEVYSFGRDNGGPTLGTGIVADSFTPPTKVIFPAGAAPIIALSANNDGYICLALDENGKVYGWGSNPFGQLGDGTTNNQLTPELLFTNAIDIYAGETFSYVLKADNTLWATGRSGYNFGLWGSIWMNQTNIQRLSWTQIDPTVAPMNLCPPKVYGVLPLHLLTFTAHLSEQRTVNSGQGTVNSEQRAVNLRWTAENEVNFDRYEVERSVNGREFSKVGRVRAANNREYSYDDNVGGLSSVVGGRFYYRLKMVDKDGLFTYSKVEQVAFNTQHPAFNITPNPATTLIQLQFSKSVNAKVDVQVSDVAGKVLIGGQWSVVGGRISIPTNKLANGTYVVRVTADGEEWSEKVVVVK